MLTASSLVQVEQSVNNPHLTGLYTIIAALIGALAAILGVWWLLSYYKGKEERDKQSLLKAAYIALKSEIETNKEFYESGVGKILKGIQSDKPLYQRSAFDFEHNTIYKANAQIICYIPDIELIKAIVRLYGFWGGLKDAIRKHDAEVEKHNNISMAPVYREKTNQLNEIEISIIRLTTMMQECYTEIEKQTELVLQKLNAQINPNKNKKRFTQALL